MVSRRRILPPPQRLSTPRLPHETLDLSPQGEQYLRITEGEKVSTDGTRSFYYDDSAHYCTVGIGHLVNGKSSCASQGIRGMKSVHTVEAGDIHKYDSIPEEQAKALFNHDKVAKAVNIVRRNVHVALHQWGFDALCCLAFNAGDLSKIAPKLLKLLNAGDYVNAPKEMLDIISSGHKPSPGLITRRRCEYNMFTTADYTPPHQ